MRIIVDLHAMRPNSECVVAHLIRGLANQPGVDIHVLLDGAVPEAAIVWRATLKPWIAEDHIRWLSPVAAAEDGQGISSNWSVRASGLLRAHVIDNLQPDWLLLPSVPGEQRGDCLRQYGERKTNARTAVLIPADEVAAGDERYAKLCRQELRAAEVLLVAPGEKEKWVKPCVLPADRVVEVAGMTRQQPGVQEATREQLESFANDVLTALEIPRQPAVGTQSEPVEPVTRLPRLAYVSPLPPDRTGIAEYAAELIPELARFYTLELIHVGQPSDDPALSGRFSTCSLADFEVRARQGKYDRILYHMGNSPFHLPMFDLIRHHPGTVVLHDFFLTHGLVPDAARLAHALYESHGWKALQRLQSVGKDQAIWEYPANYGVLRHAGGVIVHSGYTGRLARQWYGRRIPGCWDEIPHLRGEPQRRDKAEARRLLGIEEDAFVVCSFGATGPAKLTHRLFGVWLELQSQLPRAGQLVCVGQDHGGEYGLELSKVVRASHGTAPIRITGFASRETYALWRDSADVAVQLRAHARGETSGAVLDCLVAGLPLIFNAHGAMEDLPDEVGIKLPDRFENRALKTALLRLMEDGDLRQQLSAAGRAYVRSHCAPGQIARLYRDAIERHAGQSALQRERALIGAMGDSDHVPTGEQMAQVSQTLVEARPVAQAQLLVDVSAIARHDLKTGVERVVRAQIKALLDDGPHGFRVEPVYLTEEGGTWHYRYARAYACALLGLMPTGLTDAPVTVCAGDVLYIPDRYSEGLVQSGKAGLYQRWRALGVRVYCLIHDLLPLSMPHCFPEGAAEEHAQYLQAAAENATGLIALCATGQRELELWLASRPPRRPDPLALAYLPHGADRWEAPSGAARHKRVRKVGKLAAKRPTFLVVGTIEPRKGYLQLLDAFEALWQAGEAVNLVIVGREGWVGLPDSERRTIPEIIARLRRHKQRNRQLFWLDGIGDGDLARVYAQATALVSASEGEGFGLPLIEAAQAGLPLILRDISVFREVAGQGGYYFTGDNGKDLADALRDWMRLDKRGRAPAPDAVCWLTWRENAQRLSRILMGEETNGPVSLPASA